MKYLVLLFAVLICATGAYVENNIDKQALADADYAQNRCLGRHITASHYDCTCVAAHIYDIRRKGDTSTALETLINSAYKDCPDTNAVANAHYARCVDWASRQRPDYNEFCKCYAGNYAANFQKIPTFSSNQRVAMMTNAYKECGVGKPLVEQRERRSFIQNLKERGLYNFFFSGNITQE